MLALAKLDNTGEETPETSTEPTFHFSDSVLPVRFRGKLQSRHEHRTLAPNSNNQDYQTAELGLAQVVHCQWGDHAVCSLQLPKEFLRPSAGRLYQCILIVGRGSTVFLPRGALELE